MVTTYFSFLDPNKIFGMVGRCGGGYNTVWEDWTPEGRAAREKIVKEFEEGMNAICGHYSKLEESILAEGFRNPIIITNGLPVRKKLKHIPPELRKVHSSKWLLMEGFTGGSRLWVAQKHNIPVPCMINDFSNKGMYPIKISSIDQALLYYKDQPKTLSFHPRYGLSEEFDNEKIGYHLGAEWSEEKIVVERAPLWVKTMNKYGYYVDRLQPYVLNILKEQGIIQPTNLKKRANFK